MAVLVTAIHAGMESGAKITVVAVHPAKRCIGGPAWMAGTSPARTLLELLALQSRVAV